MATRMPGTVLTATLGMVIGLLAAFAAPAGAAPIAELTPASHAFGSQHVGTESTRFDFTLANTGDGQITVASVGKGGNNPGQFKIKNGGSCDPGVVLDSVTPSCTVRVTFDPGSLGNKNAQIQVVTDLAPEPLIVAVTGTAIPAPAVTIGVSSAAIPFESRMIGDGPGVPRTVEVSSQGSLPLQIGAITLSGADAAQFALDPAGCENQTLTQGQICRFDVTFVPSTAGHKKAEVAIASNAPDAPSIVHLAGIGTAPPPPPGRARTGLGSVLPKVKSGRLSLPLTCSVVETSRCAGKLTIRANGKALGLKGGKAKRNMVIGTRAYSFTGARKTFAARLKGVALKQLRKRGRLKVRVVVTTKQPDGTVITRTFGRTARLSQ